MFDHTSPRRHRVGAALLAALLTVAGLALTTAPAAQATPSFSLDRLAGAKRWDTAAEIAKKTFPTGATNAIIANGIDFPDALAANYLAGTLDAPIILSIQSDVPDASMAVLADLGVENVTLVGGTAVLGSAVAAELAGAGYNVNRVAGSNRYDTAERVAREPGAAAVGTLDDERVAIVATGQGFADALVAGPVAYAMGFPIILTPTAALGSDAESALLALEIDHVLVVGGLAAVSSTAKSAIETLGISTERISGNDRFATATAVANMAISRLAFDPEHVNVATGLNFPDAISGGPHGGEEKAPIVLSAGVPQATCDFLTAKTDTLSSGHIFGGTGVVSIADEGGLEECGGASPTNQTYTVVPAAKASIVVGETRDFTVTNLGTTTLVDIGLIDCANLSVSGGIVTFAATDGAATGMGTTAAAHLTRINGVEGDNGDGSSNVTVVDGAVTFQVTGDANGCFAAVVWDDADDGDDLDLDPDGKPTEAFGAGGKTSVFAVGGLTATPATALRPYGRTHSVTAQITNGSGANTPADGLQVRFSVERITVDDFDEGCGGSFPSFTTVLVTTGVVVSDIAGSATFTYTGPSDPSANDDSTVDCISAFVDLDGDATVDGGEPTASTTVTFDDAVAVVTSVRINRPAPTGLVGGSVTFTADLLDQYGDGVANKPLTAELFRNAATTPVFVQATTTNTEGRITVSYGGPGAQADDIFVVCVENTVDTNARCDVILDDDGNDNTADTPNAQSTFKWVSTPTTVTSTGSNSCVLAANLANDTVDVEDSANAGRNLRLRFDNNDQFTIISGNPLNPTSTGVLQDQFEAALSAGDRIKSNYAPTGVSSFTLVNDTDCATSQQEVSTG